VTSMFIVCPTGSATPSFSPSLKASCKGGPTAVSGISGHARDGCAFFVRTPIPDRHSEGLLVGV
jgi:hypothetical protein